MKISEKMKEVEAFDALFDRWRHAARTLADIDEHGSIDVYGEYDKITVAKGDARFDRLRAIVVDTVQEAEAALVAQGYEIDVDAEELGGDE